MMTIRRRTPLRTDWKGLLLDVSKEAALYGLNYRTAISVPVEQWISGPDVGDISAAVMRFRVLIRSIAEGPAAKAIAEGQETVFELNMLWLAPDEADEEVQFLIVCCKAEDGEPSVTILLSEEMMNRVLH